MVLGDTFVRLQLPREGSCSPKGAQLQGTVVLSTSGCDSGLSINLVATIYMPPLRYVPSPSHAKNARIRDFFEPPLPSIDTTPFI